jgi:hypothetical protein
MKVVSLSFSVKLSAELNSLTTMGCGASKSVSVANPPTAAPSHAAVDASATTTSSQHRGSAPRATSDTIEEDLDAQPQNTAIDFSTSNQRKSEVAGASIPAPASSKPQTKSPNNVSETTAVPQDQKIPVNNDEDDLGIEDDPGDTELDADPLLEQEFADLDDSQIDEQTLGGENIAEANRPPTPGKICAMSHYTLIA